MQIIGRYDPRRAVVPADRRTDDDANAKQCFFRG